MTGNRYRHIFIFTGQGAQYHGMARSLYLTEPVFRFWMDELDIIPKQKISVSVTRFLYPDLEEISHESSKTDKGTSFDRTVVSHPALFMVQFSLAKTLIHYGIVPDCLMGASLGEFVALSLAGVVSPKIMLGALIDHAQAIEAHCSPGAMVGVQDSPGLYDKDSVLHHNSSLAGISSPRHFVVSGNQPDMDKVIHHLSRMGIPFVQLPIRFGFHSPNIDPAGPVWEKQLKESLGTDRLPPPGIDVISCAKGGFVDLPAFDFLISIGRVPILFPRALETLDRKIKSQSGIGGKPVNIIDLGPGSYSSGFVRQNKILDRDTRMYRIMTLFGNEIRNLNKLKAELVSV